MIILLLYTIVFQVGNNYIVNYIDPYFAFFGIYALSTVVFLIFNFKKGTFNLNNSKYSIPIIITGQILSPIFYFKGMFLTDILTQSVIYAFYPITIFVFSKVYDKEKIFNVKNLTLILVIAIQMFILIKNTKIDEGFVYLLISCLLLIVHKILHKVAINRTGAINEKAMTFYGLLGSTLLGLALILINKDNILNSFDFVSYINVDTNRGVLFVALFLAVIFLLGKVQYKRNEVLNKNKFEELYLYIIIAPPFAVLLNNYLYFIDKKVEVNFSIYGLEGALYLIIFLIIKLDWRIILTYISSALLFITLFSNNILIPINIKKTDTVKIIYNEINRIGLIEKYQNKWFFIKNEIDYDKYQFIKKEVNLNSKNQFKNVLTNENIQLYFKDYIASDESIIVYDTYNYKKYIFKELNEDIYNRMKLFKKVADDKDYLVNFEILEDKDKKHYIITDFINGMTFEDYYEQYDNNYIERINQKALIKDIIKVAEINLDLMKSGWINRDIHQNNILITSNGITMIDYDLIFPIQENEKIVDTNGFKNNLYDIYRFFYPKRNIIKKKFYFEEQPPLNFKHNKEIINQNLRIMNRYIFDNSYIYSKDCKDKEIYGMENLIDDLKKINTTYIKNDNELNSIQSDCTNNALFYNNIGQPSFQVFNLPSKFFDFNYIKIFNYNKLDLKSFVNQTIRYNLQQTGTKNYAFDIDDKKAQEEIISFLNSK